MPGPINSINVTPTSVLRLNRMEIRYYYGYSQSNFVTAWGKSEGGERPYQEYNDVVNNT